jgi:nucleotide sugar dehydrogenase
MCHELDIDVDEMLDAAETKGHAIMRLKPGLGTGGHCLPIDALYLAWLRREHFGKSFRFAELADEINSYMPTHAVQRARNLLLARRIRMWDARILVLGVAYKPGVADTRESPSLQLIRLLEEAGATVTALDPHVNSHEDADLAWKTAGLHDLVIIATAHPEFDYEMIRESAVEILDSRNCYARGAEKVHKL